MKYSRNQKSYDVKTFLNKEIPKSKTRFYTLRPSLGNMFFKVLLTMAFFCSFFLWGFDSSAVYKGMAIYASPFLHTGANTININFENSFIHTSSSLIGFKEETLLPPKKEPKAQPQENISEQTVHTNGVEIKNETDFSVDTLSYLSEPIHINRNSKVLIVHTHGSESYTPSKKYPFEHSGNYRSQNKEYNMIRVGEKLADALKSKGIQVIHDKTINDYPSYNDSYNKTERVIKSYLEKDKDIAFVFDIHRDAAGSADNIIKFTADIEGEKVAQVMTVCGTNANLDNPNWMQNLHLAVHIQNYFNINYPGLLRPLNLRKERFNMHLTTGSLLFEIGTNGNTLEEALMAADILGKGIGDFILQNS